MGTVANEWEPIPLRAPDPREALAAWYLRRRHRSLWLLPLTAALTGFVTLLLLRGTAGDPQKNYKESKAALLALVPPDIPPGENAADDYESAAKARIPYAPGAGDDDPYNDQSVDGEHFEHQAIQAYVNGNGAALQLLHAGATKTKCKWNVDYMLGYDLPNYAGSQHHSVCLLAIHARVAAHAGDHQAAAKSCAAAYKLAQHTGAVPLLYCSQQTCALAEQTDKAVQGIVSYDTPRSLSDVAAYRQALWRGRDPESWVARWLAGEKAIGLYTVDAVAAGAMPAPARTRAVLAHMAPGRNGSLLYGAERECLAAVIDDLASSVSRGAWLTRKDAISLVASHQTGPATLAVTAMSRYGSDLEQFARCEEQARVTDAGLAFLEFRVKHGRNPKSLEDLVPEFLPAVPRGVFHPAPLRMRVDPDRLGVEQWDIKTLTVTWSHQGTIRIYALGPNGKDDEGYGSPREKNAASRSGDDTVFRVPPMRTAQAAPGEQP